MTYGDGDGTQLRPLVAIDVAGHEMSHGVTSRTAKLVYSGESGGLNESTSDIFGTAVEFYAGNSADPGDYLIGEKIMIGGKGYLRNMMDPTADGRSIDHYSKYKSGTDVHFSSGIANNFFYLLSEGGKNRTSGKTVTGISRAKAEKIWYRALTVYMTSVSYTHLHARKPTRSRTAAPELRRKGQRRADPLRGGEPDPRLRGLSKARQAARIALESLGRRVPGAC